MVQFAPFHVSLSGTNNIVSISHTHTFILYLIYYLGNMFRLTIESSSGPYIKNE